MMIWMLLMSMTMTTKVDGLTTMMTLMTSEAEEIQEAEGLAQQHPVDNSYLHPPPVRLPSAGIDKKGNESGGGRDKNLKLHEEEQQDIARVVDNTAGVQAPPPKDSVGSWDYPALEDIDQEESVPETTLPVETNSSVIPHMDSQEDPVIDIQEFADDKAPTGPAENYARVEPTNAVPLVTNGVVDNEQGTMGRW
jgi:hypothetical protein